MDPFVGRLRATGRPGRLGCAATMRDADVGASPGPGSAADSAAACACTNAAGRGRLGGRQSRRQQRADHPGQHVAGPGGGRPGLPGRVQVDRAAGVGDDGDVALEQHGGAERVGQLAGGADPVVPGRVAGQPGEFTGVRGQHRRRAAVGDQLGVGGQDGQPVGVDEHRQVGAPARTTARRRRRRRCPIPARRPRPAPARPTPGWATR